MPNADTPLLVCEDLTKSFSGVQVLRGVSLSVGRGRALGVVGENGAGKSTLMNLIGGIHRPDSGQMQFNGKPYSPSGPLDAGRAGIAFVHQELNLFGNLSISDNLFITDYKSRSVQRTRELLESVDLHVSPDTTVDSLPQGERQLVEIAKALRTDAKLIIFDEPTTSLSAREAARLFTTIGKLKASGLSVIYISHALEDVRRLCDDIVILRDGAAVSSGEIAEFPIERMITLMVGRPISQLYPAREITIGGPVLAAQGLSQPGIVENISFELHAGEVLGLGGLMGSGRSELARILFGLDPHRNGEVTLNGEPLGRGGPRDRIARGLAMLTESRRDDGLFMTAPISENLKIVHRDPRRIPELVRSLCIACSNPDRQPVQQLSGGNQQKVALGKWLVQTPKVLLLDEPTRGIDVGARFEIYTLMNTLAAQGVALLVISSEIEELIGLCDRILVMRKGEITRSFARPFDREQILEAAV